MDDGLACSRQYQNDFLEFYIVSKTRVLKRVLVGRSPRNTFVRAIILAVFCIILFRFFFIPIRIYGKSMEPAYHDGSIDFINTLYYKFHNLKRGDVVAVGIGSGHGYMYLKRVAGLPGEKLSFKDGMLIINGRVVSEPYVKYKYDWNMPEVPIGKDEYFVVGDNRSGPISEHAKGRVYKNKIMGRPLW